MQCRFIDTGFNDAYTNMAVDEALLNCCEIPTLRIYGWKPAISIGYSQNIQKEINLEECKRLNIGIVRRITGGKAVYHDKELTYSFILPENANLLPKDITESYRLIANALVLAIKKIGIKAEIKNQVEKFLTPICFNSSNWYELAVNNKKISGSAQRRFNGKILQHGPILMDYDHEKNALLFKSDNEINNPDNLKKRITSIKHELNKNISYNELTEAVKQGFKENFNFNIVKDSLTEEEKASAEILKKEKYSTEEWNYGLLTKTI